MELIKKLETTLLNLRGAFFKDQPFHYCGLETNKDDYSFLGKDGELMTVIRFSGIEFFAGDQEILEREPIIQKAFRAIFKDGNHALEFVYERNKAFNRRVLNESIRPAKDTAKQLNLDIADLIEEDAEKLDNYIVHENSALIFWTLPDALGKKERKRENERKTNTLNSIGFSFNDIQSGLTEYKALKKHHETAMEQFIDALNGRQVGFTLEKMEVHEAARFIKMQIHPKLTADDWNPILMGDTPSPRLIDGAPKDDLSDLLYPSLGWQLCPNDIEEKNGYVYTGGLYYAPILIETFPSTNDLEPFFELFSDIKPTTPYRIRTLMSGKAISQQDMFRAGIAGFGAFLKDNRDIYQQIKNLVDYEKDGGLCVKTRKVVITWGATIDEVENNFEEIFRALQSWGMTPITDKGDIKESFLSSIGGFSRQSVATGTPVPLESLVPLLPFFRPSAPWQSGSINFRTTDGKLFPWQPGSPLQSVQTNLILGSPGNGKSMLANIINFSRCLMAGAQRLPRISIIEMQPSSIGLIDTLRAKLPPNEKHQAIYHRMNMNDGINPLDTMPGLRHPTAYDKKFLIDFISVCVSAGEYPEFRDILTESIELVYQKFGSNKNAKPYRSGKVKSIDLLLDELGFHENNESAEPTWFDVEDFLFTKNKRAEAKKAHSQAMPLLDDLASIANDSESIRGRYSRIEHNGEDYVSLFTRKISTLINSYPCFAKPSELDFDNARIISIDLADVATGKSEIAIMGTFSAWLTSRYFYLVEEKLPPIPPLYKPHYENLILEIKRDLKHLGMEELHRYENTPDVITMIERLMAEGRKDDVGTTLITQQITSFSDRMRELATNIFLLVGGASPEEVTKISNFMRLTETEEASLLNGMVHGPKPDGSGSSFLYRYKFKASGWRSQVLSNTRSPSFLWTLTTTNNDSVLSKMVRKELGYNPGIKALVERFPTGSADSYIEKLKEKKNDKNPLSLESTNSKAEAIDEVAKEVIHAYYKKHGRS